MKTIPNFIVAGTSVKDRHIPCESVDFAQPGLVRFAPLQSGPLHAVPYRGRQMRWGEKREATTDLTETGRQFSTSEMAGGGGVNVAAALGEGALFLDTNAASDSVAEFLGERGVTTVPLGDLHPGVNAVLTQRGTADRAILKSPARHTARITLDPAIAAALRRTVLVVNSPKNFRILAQLASGAGRIFAALTGLTPKIHLALAMRAELGTCNVSEFCDILREAGVNEALYEAVDEKPASRPAIAQAMREFRKRVPFRNLVVSMGAAGAMLMPDKSSVALHVVASPSLAQRERLLGVARGSIRQNGAGDRFFAALAAAFADSSDLVESVRKATASVVSSFARDVRLTPSQTSVVIFAH